MQMRLHSTPMNNILMYISRIFLIFLALCSFWASAELVNITRPQVVHVDSDRDGVIDENDQCHETQRDHMVDDRGCMLSSVDKHSITLNIQFNTDSAVVKPEFFGEVKRVADFMVQYPRTRMMIEGHTDSDGAASYNLRLSERRAQAVAKVLVERFGIPVIRLTAKGYGEQQPLVANDSAKNKYCNRRVMAVVRSITQQLSTVSNQ